MDIDYDLFVLDPKNKSSTPEQLRDCIFDALTVLNNRTDPGRISLCNHCYCMTHTINGKCAKCGEVK